jgi:glycosyltransferase involved in cell wall biosynthesis
MAAAMFLLRTGLKKSNYLIGHVELSPLRIQSAVNPRDYAAVLYEYFHAVNSVTLFREAGTPAILDMHNVLWRSMEQRLKESSKWPGWFKSASLRRYRRREESAWEKYDALIAINRREHELVQPRLRASQKLFYAPMGTDLLLWPKRWQPATPPRIVCYGGFGSSHNEAAALRCHGRIMPAVWKLFPTVELWLVGSNPSSRLRRLACDRRVRVTGFVEQAQEVLSSMSMVLCPWSGTYGFRSRVVEVMALGVPVVASPDAVDGMELKDGYGIVLAHSDEQMAQHALNWLLDRKQLTAQSNLARSEMERLYSLKNTYERFFDELCTWLDQRRTPSPSLITDH